MLGKVYMLAIGCTASGGASLEINLLKSGIITRSVDAQKFSTRDEESNLPDDLVVSDIPVSFGLGYLKSLYNSGFLMRLVPSASIEASSSILEVPGMTGAPMVKSGRQFLLSLQTTLECCFNIQSKYVSVTSLRREGRGEVPVVGESCMKNTWGAKGLFLE